MLRQIACPPPMPPDLALVRADALAPVPWRNGGGLTRELCAWPAPDDWVLRVSVATIERDGPFSSFPGVERWFGVLDGDGVELAQGGSRVVLRPGDALHRFRGEEVPSCRLLGAPTQDFNLMVRRGAAVATVTPVPAGHAATSDWSGCFAVTPMRVRRGADDDWQPLPAYALAWTTAPARLEIDAGAGARGWRMDVVLAKGVRR